LVSLLRAGAGPKSDIDVWTFVQTFFFFMKEIIAVIRPSKWALTKEQLLRLGIHGFSTMRVFGHGRSEGLRYQNDRRRKPGVTWLPKRLVMFWVEDHEAPGVIQAIIGANQSGEAGDGKIFVCRVRNAMRVRTGEMGKDAL
jgi:nitrogen regulatory protein PII 2